MNFISGMTDYSNPNSFGSRMRRRRGARLGGMIDRCFAEKGSVSIVDLGGEAMYWNIFDEEYLTSRKVTITLVNLYEENLPDNPKPHVFTNVVGDCCDLSYQDNAFDIAHSNSVIEHLVTWERMSAFASHARRVGRSYYVQTPAYWFPIEPHFGTPIFHWLPESTRTAWLMRRSVGHFPKADTLDRAMRFVQNHRLLDRKQVRHLFPEARIESEKLLGLTKSYIAMKG